MPDRRFILLGALLAATPVEGRAADLAVPDMAPIVAPYEAHDWSGFYAGIHAGGIFAEFNNNVPIDPGPVGDTNGPMGGGQIGYNWQFDRWVVGLEGDVSVIDIDARSAFARFDEDVMATLRLRGGFVWDRFFLYGTGGITVTHLEAEFTGSPSGDSLAFGPAIGAGAEVALGRMWSVKGEYLFSHVPQESISSGPVTFVGGSDNHVLRGGLNFHF